MSIYNPNSFDPSSWSVLDQFQLNTPLLPNFSPEKVIQNPPETNNPIIKKIKNHIWTPKQLAVLEAAIKEANGGRIKNLKKIAEDVNKLAALGSGKTHTPEACRHKIKKLKDERKQNKIDPQIDTDQITPQSAIVSELQETINPMEFQQDEDLLFNFFPLPTNNMLTTYSDPEAVTSPASSGKRKVPAESTSSQPKKVKIYPAKEKQKHGVWSANQLEVVKRAAENVNAITAKNKNAPFLIEVNDLAAKCDGDSHSRKSFDAKILQLRERENLRKTLDPEKHMSEDDFELLISSPLEKAELDKLILLRDSGLSIPQCALKVGKTKGVCERILRKHQKLKSAT